MAERHGGSECHTRSGTISSMSAYEFLRNNAWTLQTFFDNANGIQKPPFKRNQFGGTVIEGKMFIFGDMRGSANQRDYHPIIASMRA